MPILYRGGIAANALVPLAGAGAASPAPSSPSGVPYAIRHASAPPAIPADLGDVRCVGGERRERGLREKRELASEGKISCRDLSRYGRGETSASESPGARLLAVFPYRKRRTTRRLLHDATRRRRGGAKSRARRFLIEGEVMFGGARKGMAKKGARRCVAL